MTLKPWVPQNASPAWAILIPQKVLDRGMTYLDYKSRLTDKLEAAIRYRDPAEDLILAEVPFPIPSDPRQAALEIVEATGLPLFPTQTVTQVPDDPDLAATIEDQTLTDLMPEFLAAM